MLTVGRYLDFETVGEPKVSPDGSQVIFTRRSVDKIKDTFESTLWIMSADGGKLRFLSKGSNPVWSPDGTRIAFMLEGEPGVQLHVRYMDAEEPSPRSPSRRSLRQTRLVPGRQLDRLQHVCPEGPDWRIDLPAAPSERSGPRRPGSSAVSTIGPTDRLSR